MEIEERGVYRDESDPAKRLYLVLSVSNHLETYERVVSFVSFGWGDRDGHRYSWCCSPEFFEGRFSLFESGRHRHWETIYFSKDRRYLVSSFAGYRLATTPEEDIRCTSGETPDGKYFGMIHIWRDGYSEEMLVQSEPYFKSKRTACQSMRRLAKRIREYFKEVESNRVNKR